MSALCPGTRVLFICLCIAAAIKSAALVAGW